MQQGIKKLQWFEYFKVVFLEILNAGFCKSGHIYTCTFTVNMAHTGLQLQAVWGVTLSQEPVTCKLAHTYTGLLHALWGHTKNY